MRPRRSADYFGTLVDASYSHRVAQVAETEIERAETETHLCIACTMCDANRDADAQAGERFILV